MGRRLQTIYEYFSYYSVQEIDDMLYNLSIEEKRIIMARYGKNLHNPQPSNEWGKENSEKYYGTLIPKMKRLLSKGIETQSTVLSVEQTESSIVIPDSPKIETIDYTPRLLQLLKKGKNNREICENLNITSRQLYEELLKLKNKGIRHYRKYYSDGSIKYGNISTMKSLNITIPTLSEINQPMPSALELNLYFSKGYIANSVIKHLYFGPQDIVLSESIFNLLQGRTINYEDVRNIETFRQGLSQSSDIPKTLKRTNQPLSQIEKFNKRYGK